MYRLRRIPIISRNTFPGWSDPLGMPDLEWYVRASAVKSESNILVIDQEEWPASTKTERLETSKKFAIVYKTIKHFIPETLIGFYSYSPTRDLFNAISPKNSKSFADWQSQNDDLAEHISCVDVLFPSIYYFYTRAINGPSITNNAPLYFQRNIDEAARLRDTFGNPSRQIIPYVWWEKHPGGPWLDADVWQSMVQTSLDRTGNCLAWGGFTRTWNPSDSWLEPLKNAQALPS